jgi:hypothetical protein
MVIPSTWWENSPLVIQEARVVGVPVWRRISVEWPKRSAMEWTGLHFLTGSALDLGGKD